MFGIRQIVENFVAKYQTGSIIRWVYIHSYIGRLRYRLNLGTYPLTFRGKLGNLITTQRAKVHLVVTILFFGYTRSLVALILFIVTPNGEFQLMQYMHITPSSFTVVGRIILLTQYQLSNIYLSEYESLALGWPCTCVYARIVLPDVNTNHSYVHGMHTYTVTPPGGCKNGRCM